MSKSIEEIVEELEHLVQWETPEHEKEVKDWLTQTLETERQKREGVVEKFATHLLNCIEKGNVETAISLIKLKALTQPNNK